jgi:hypothetical protein
VQFYIHAVCTGVHLRSADVCVCVCVCFSPSLSLSFRDLAEHSLWLCLDVEVMGEARSMQCAVSCGNRKHTHSHMDTSKCGA